MTDYKDGGYIPGDIVKPSNPYKKNAEVWDTGYSAGYNYGFNAGYKTGKSNTNDEFIALLTQKANVLAIDMDEEEDDNRRSYLFDVVDAFNVVIGYLESE